MTLADEVEALTNPDGSCDFCHHSSPDHWNSCELDATYWRCVDLARRVGEMEQRNAELSTFELIVRHD